MSKDTDIISSKFPGSAENAAKVINNGGIIVYPTETLYGIGGMATDPGVIDTIYDIKQRGRGNPMLVLVRDTEMIGSFFKISTHYMELYKKFSEFPLTIILEQKYIFPDELSAGTKNIGVRISANSFVESLFNYVDVPIISTSANISGKENSTSIDEIIGMFRGKVDLIVDSGNLPVSKGSSVLDLTKNPPEIIREGDIEKEKLKEFIIGNN